MTAHRIRNLGLLSIVGAAAYFVFHTNTIENATVIDKGEHRGTIVRTVEEDYPETEGFTQATITVDKYHKCLRGPADLSPLKVGDELEWVKYRYGLIGPCDYVTEYKVKE